MNKTKEVCEEGCPDCMDEKKFGCELCEDTGIVQEPEFGEQGYTTGYYETKCKSTYHITD